MPPPSISNFEISQYQGVKVLYEATFRWNYTQEFTYYNHIENLNDIKLVAVPSIVNGRVINFNEYVGQFRFKQTYRVKVEAENCAGSSSSTQLILEGKDYLFVVFLLLFFLYYTSQTLFLTGSIFFLSVQL